MSSNTASHRRVVVQARATRQQRRQHARLVLWLEILRPGRVDDHLTDPAGALLRVLVLLSEGEMAVTHFSARRPLINKPPGIGAMHHRCSKST